MSNILLRSLLTHDCKLCVLSDRSFTSYQFHICAICSSTSHHILCIWFLFLERYKAQWLMVTCCSVCLVEKMQETWTLCKCSSNPINSTVSQQITSLYMPSAHQLLTNTLETHMITEEWWCWDICQSNLFWAISQSQYLVLCGIELSAAF